MRTMRSFYLYIFSLAICGQTRAGPKHCFALTSNEICFCYVCYTLYRYQTSAMKNLIKFLPCNRTYTNSSTQIMQKITTLVILKQNHNVLTLIVQK